MRRLVGALLVFTALAVARAAPTPGQTPVFRAGADAVTVGVSVRRGNRPVSGLTIGDFTLTDNGVVQTLTTMSYEKRPIDVTVLFDVSGSVTGAVMDQLRRSIVDLRRSMGADDRLRVWTFNMRIRQLLAFDAPPASADAAFAALSAGGSSAVRDAVAVALASGGSPDRRPLVVLFSDGKDSISLQTPDLLLDLARATTPTVSVVLATPARTTSDRVYAELVAETGGSLVSLLPTDTLGGSLRSALEQFRSSYVLAYAPTGVTTVGAHAIAVTVSRPGLDVRARRGYVVR